MGDESGDTIYMHVHVGSHGSNANYALFSVHQNSIKILRSVHNTTKWLQKK